MHGKAQKRWLQQNEESQQGIKKLPEVDDDDDDDDEDDDDGKKQEMRRYIKCLKSTTTMTRPKGFTFIPNDSIMVDSRGNFIKHASLYGMLYGRCCVQLLLV